MLLALIFNVLTAECLEIDCRLFACLLSLLVIYMICLLGEANSVPFDLAEGESELVAGFMTEYASIYFSLIMLTEYGSIIVLTILMTQLFGLPYIITLLFGLLVVCHTSTSLNRLNYDELMTYTWTGILPLIFISLLYLCII